MARLLAIFLISCLLSFASPINIEGLSYVSADPGQATGGIVVTDYSGEPMPYRCDSATGFAGCGATLPESARWVFDATNDSVELIRTSVNSWNV